MWRLRCLAGISGALVIGASAARGNMLVNGGMESGIAPQQPDNLVYVTTVTHPTALTGWTIVSGAIDIVPSSYFQSSQGSFSVDLVGTPGVGSISQIVNTTSGNLYTLTFDFAINPERGPVDERGYTKQLEIQAIGTNGTTTQEYTGTAAGRTNVAMGYSSNSFTFTANGPTTTILLRARTPLSLPGGLTASTVRTGPVVDNLDLELGSGGVIPEPASVAILGLGGSLLLFRRRRARDRTN